MQRSDRCAIGTHAIEPLELRTLLSAPYDFAGVGVRFGQAGAAVFQTVGTLNAGPLTAGRNASVSSTGGLALQTLTASGDVLLTSTGGAVTVGNLAAGGVVRLSADALLVDAGRPNHRSRGVPLGGAADRASWRHGNAMVGNVHDALALEFALVGSTLRALHDAECAISGAPFAQSGTRFHLAAGDVMKIGPTPIGMRGYLCVHGGFRGEEILGRQTSLEPIKRGQILECLAAVPQGLRAGGGSRSGVARRPRVAAGWVELRPLGANVRIVWLGDPSANAQVPGRTDLAGRARARVQRGLAGHLRGCSATPDRACQ